MKTTYCIIFISASPTGNSADITGIFQSTALIVVAYRFGDEVAATDATSEIELVFNFDYGYVVVHPANVVVLMPVEHVIC